MRLGYSRLGLGWLIDAETPPDASVFAVLSASNTRPSTVTFVEDPQLMRMLSTGVYGVCCAHTSAAAAACTTSRKQICMHHPPPAIFLSLALSSLSPILLPDTYPCCYRSGVSVSFSTSSSTTLYTQPQKLADISASLLLQANAATQNSETREAKQCGSQADV